MIEETFEYKGIKFIYFKSIASSNSRKNIILLHGYSFNSQIWEDVGLVKLLNELGYNVYAIDIPGFPKSRNKSGDSIFLDFLKAFSDPLGNVSILGSSAGGHLAAKFAEAFPEKVSQLILVGAVGLEEMRLQKKIRILGIWGRNDKVSNPISAKKIIESFGGRFVEIDGNHACYLDSPEEFKKAIEEFLK
ncbi:MAG: alpha/beta fold hydrolase [Candidatus Micrarchaeia archaeon]